MKKMNSFKQLFFLCALLVISSHAWGYSSTKLTVNISGNGQIAVNTSAEKPSSWSSNSVTKEQGPHGLFETRVTDTYYIWVNPNDGYYCSGVSEGSWNNAGYYTVAFKGSTGTTEKTVTATFVGNKYTLSFDGNGDTGGSMADQSFIYGTAQNIRSNGYERNYNISYDANGGDCDRSSDIAVSTFLGWAKTTKGSVLYTDGQSLSLPTPIPDHNSTINLFAQWESSSIILPEPTRDGFLFDGWYNGDTWVGIGGSEITPTTDMSLTAHWAEKLTPVFVLDKTEIELEQKAVLTMNNVSNPDIQIAPEGIVSFNPTTGELTALTVGTVTISATQEATDTYSYKHEELTLTVVKKTPSLTVLLNNEERNSIYVAQGKTANVSFIKTPDVDVVVTNVSGSNFAAYSNGVITGSAIGTAVFRATLPETATYQSTSVDFTINVTENYAHLPIHINSRSVYDVVKVGASGTNSWEDDRGIIVGGSDGWFDGTTNWDDKYVTIHFDGIPDKLSFDFLYIYRDNGLNKMTATAPGSSTQPGQYYFLYIEESANGSSWTPISWQHTEPNKDDWQNSGEQQLKKTTRYLRFHLHANYGACYRNVRISELKYVDDPVPASIDLGTAIIYSGQVSKNALINWCNIAPMTITSSNDRFTVSPTSFGNYEEYGSQELTISYTHGSEVGPQEADITISNGNSSYDKTIYVTANTIKRQQSITWDEQISSTGFAMNVGEQYPDAMIPTVATVESGEKVIFTSDNSDIIEVIADTALLAKAVGTVNITAYQAGDAEYAETSDTKQFIVTELLKQSITWEQSFYSLLTTSDPIELNATATSGGEINYTSADESVVRIENGLLIVVGEGETFITASQAGGEVNEHTYLPISMNNYVIVRNPASQCNGLALSANSLTLKGNSHEYDLSGIPQTLTFSAKHGEKSALWGTGVSYGALIVDQYANINNLWDWYEVYNTIVGTDETASGNISLDESATKLRFKTGESAVEHTISNIRVTRQKFMRSDVMAVDENVEANATWQKTITISHSNIDLMTVTSKQGLLNINVTTLGEGCDDFSDDAFIVSFTPTVKYEDYYDTIVITDEKADPTIIEIPVHLFSQGLNQVINDFELAASCLTTNVLEPFHATATSGLEVVYLSSDSTIAYVDENKQLIILAAGTVTITAYQAGDDRYESASDDKTIEIQLTPTTITEAPQATEIAVGQSLANSKLIGGQGSVEGSFAWQAPETMPEAGEQTFTVVFTPTNNTIYAAATTEVTVHVEDGQLTQTITWEDVFPELFYQGMSFELTATASSELPVEYTSSDETIARIEGTTLYPLAAGTVTISASQEGNEFYLAADSVKKQLIVSPIPTTYGEYQAAFCDGDSVEFAGKWYFVATEDSVLVPEKNIYGGDSIVAFTATVLPRHFFAEDTTINMDDSLLWREKEYGLFTPGTYTLYDSLKNIEGCDSVYALQLTVNAIPYLIEEVTTACQHEDATWRDQTLPTAEAGTFVLYDSLKSIYGMDSVYQLTLTVYPTYALEDEAQTIYVGATAEWRGIDLSLIPVGDTLLTKIYSTLQGCDSVYTMRLTVNEAPTTYGVDSIYICGRGDVAFYDNAEYSKPSKTPFTVTLSTPNQFGGDSIVELWVLASNKYDMSFSKEIKEGDEEEWQGIDLSLLPAGDTTLVVIYTTVHGCDSTFTLHLTVKPVQQTTTALDKADAVEDKPYKFFHNGQMYIRKNGQLYNLQGIKVDEE